MFQVVGPGESLGDLVDGTRIRKKKKTENWGTFIRNTTDSTVVCVCVCKHAKTHIQIEIFIRTCSYLLHLYMSFSFQICMS